MTRITALALAALLLAGCATKTMEPAAEPAAEAPAAMAPSEEGTLPSPDAQPILLTDKALPDGGEVIGISGSGPVSGVSGWAVHGVADSVAWRFGPADAGFIRVAGQPDVDWQYIQVAESWGVRCTVEPATNATPCAVIRIQPVQPGSMSSGGLALDQHITCLRSDVGVQDATLTVDGGTPHVLAGGCVTGAESDAIQQEMLAGQNVTLNASYQPKAAPQAVTIPTYGLKQALSLRDWIVAQYKAGKLKTAG